jgi:predicted ATPase
MTHPGNGSFDHLIIQLDGRLARIEHAIDRLLDETDARHEKVNGRLTVLEHRNSEAKGGWYMFGVIGTAAGVVGGLVTKWFHGG